METKELLTALKELFPGVSIRVYRSTLYGRSHHTKMKQGLLFPNPQEVEIGICDHSDAEPVD